MAKKKRTEALYEEISKVGKLYPYSTDKDTLTEEIAEANIDLHNSESLRKHSAKVIETKNAITKMRNKEIETLVSEASMHNIEELSLQQEIENLKKELKDIREYEHKYDYRYRQFSRDALIRKISDMDSKLKLESKLRGEAQTEVVERGKKQIELEAVTQELIRTEKELERETKRATRRKRFIDENILPAKQQDNYDRLLLDLKNFLAQLMEAYNG